MSRLRSVERDEHEVVEACRRAGWTLRHRSAPAAADRAALDRAVGELVDAVGTALAADPTAVPHTVRRAALRVARQVETSRRRSPDGRGAGRGVHPVGKKRSARRGPAPFTSSIRLGRMG